MPNSIFQHPIINLKEGEIAAGPWYFCFIDHILKVGSKNSLLEI